MFPGPKESRLIGCLTNFLGPKDSDHVCGLQESNSQTFWPRDVSLNGTIFCVCAILAFSALKGALSSVLKNWSETIAKRQHEGDYDERVVAKSKSVINLVSGSCAEPSTTPSSTVSSSLGIFGSEDHEIRYETRTVRPSSNHQKESLIEHDRVTNSQERHQDIRSRTTPRSPMTRELSQTSEKSYSLYKSPCAYYWKLGYW